MPRPDFWFVYILKCANGAFYTGIAKDIPARLKAHNNGTGARYTRSFGPVKLVWKERRTTKSLALKREAWIKSLSKTDKTALVKKKSENLPASRTSKLNVRRNPVDPKRTRP